MCCWRWWRQIPDELGAIVGAFKVCKYLPTSESPQLVSVESKKFSRCEEGAPSLLRLFSVHSCSWIQLVDVLYRNAPVVVIRVIIISIAAGEYVGSIWSSMELYNFC